MKKEASDKTVFILLVIAIVVISMGAYIIYDYSTSYNDSLTDNNYGISDSPSGSVTLNVVEKETMDGNFK